MEMLAERKIFQSRGEPLRALPQRLGDWLIEDVFRCAAPMIRSRHRGAPGRMKVRMRAMRKSVLAIAILVGAASGALADDVAEPPLPGPPVRIIDAGPPAPAKAADAKTDQAPAAVEAAPPAASARDKAAERLGEPPGNRFSFVRVDDGFLRFDLRTGQVAACNPHAEGWGCQAVPENRSALEREVESLKDEVAALKRQIENLREPPPPRPPVTVPPPNAPATQGDMTRGAPGYGDLARAGAALRNVWQRFVDAIVGFKNDVLRSS
jgi:hypothetical protein